MLKQIKDEPTRLSLLGNYLEGIKVDRVPPDAVRRVRAADARDGAEGTADHRRRAGEAVLRHHEAVLRSRSGRHRRGRLHRARVELHPALLSRLLRVPVRHVVHGGRGVEPLIDLFLIGRAHNELFDFHCL